MNLCLLMLTVSPTGNIYNIVNYTRYVSLIGQMFRKSASNGLLSP